MGGKARALRVRVTGGKLEHREHLDGTETWILKLKVPLKNTLTGQAHAWTPKKNKCSLLGAFLDGAPSLQLKEPWGLRTTFRGPGGLPARRAGGSP